jgi:DNA-directed RNA polymerase alpha subunit
MRLTKEFTDGSCTMKITVDDDTVTSDNVGGCERLTRLLDRIATNDVPKHYVALPTWHDASLSELRFSYRVFVRLKKHGIETIGQLCQHSENELLCFKGFGNGCLNEVRERLSEIEGAHLRGESYQVSDNGTKTVVVGGVTHQ